MVEGGLFHGEIFLLDGEGVAAAAGFGGVGVLEDEALTVEAVGEVEFGGG